MEGPEQFNSRKDWTGFIWQKIIQSLATAGSKDEIEKILAELIGEYEKQLIVKRLTAIILLKDGKTYRQIGETLWISPSTISTIKKNLSVNFANYQSRKNFPKTRTPNRRTRSLTEFKKEKTKSLTEEIIEFLSQPSAYNDPRERWKFLSDWKWK